MNPSSTSVITVLMLSAAVGSGSFLICMTEISKPLRLAVAVRASGGFWLWLSKLLGCPYCTGVWLSLFAVGVYRPQVVHGWLPLDLLVSVMAVSGLGMLPVWWIKKALGK